MLAGVNIKHIVLYSFQYFHQRSNMYAVCMLNLMNTEVSNKI